ncbi:MAG: MFS transporter [Actinomycetia bacterium]|nr:MFS transporter [Actinomycetes bacterium]
MPTVGEVTPPEPDYTHKWRAFIALGISMVTAVMTMSMVFVALAAIADDFEVTLRAVSWVVIVEALIISALMLPMGRLADMVGRKRVHMAGLAVFGTGAALTALAPTFGFLIAARAVMATGNAMTQSVGTAMVVAAFPPEERGKAIGAQTTAVSIGGASGPIVAGLVLQVLPWEVLFMGVLIPVAVALVAAHRFLDERQVGGGVDNDGAAFDWGGALFSGTAVVVLVLTINNPLRVDWISPLIIGGLVTVAALLVQFVGWELSRENPMLQLRLFRSRVFSLAVVTRLFGFMAITATRFLLPVHLLSLRGLAEGATGSLLFLISLGMGISASSSGRLSDRFGPRRFTVVGMTLVLATTSALMLTTRDTPLVLLAVTVFISGVAHGLWNVPNNSTILGAAPASSLGVVGAFTNLTRNLGNVFGQAIAAALVVGVMASQGFDIPLSAIAETAGAGAAFEDGWRAAYRVVTAAAAIALGLAVLTKPGLTRSARR